GVGSLVESTMFEAALNISAELIVEWTAYGNSLFREGSRSPWAAPQGVYATDTPERWLVVSVATDEQWAATGDALPRPGRGCRPWARQARRWARPARPARREAGRVGGRHRPRQGHRPAGRCRCSRGARVRRPPELPAPAVRRSPVLRGARPPDHRR